MGTKEERPDWLNKDMLDEVAFPQLTSEEIEECLKFGKTCSYPAGVELYSANERIFDSYLIEEGEVCIMDVSAGQRSCLVRYGPGRFTGDIALFTGRPASVACETATAVKALCISPPQLRQMFVERPELGEKFWRAFQRRRDVMTQTAFQGLHVYGKNDDRLTLESIEFLYRNGVPHKWMDTESDDNLAKLSRLLPGEPNLPVITLGRTVLLQQAALLELAELVGLRHKFTNAKYDLLILGSGPAGLGAAVYAASEGLTTLVLDELGPGGQAGSSSKIENYAGFPNGISGRDLAQLSYLQAIKFGAQFAAPCTVERITKHIDGFFEVTTKQGDTALAKAVIVATGVDYRRLDVDGFSNLQGLGVYYSATVIEAVLCRDCPIHVIGAGNSAGQAAMFLSKQAQKVVLVVRGDALEKSMSSYLSDRVKVNSKIEVRFQTEVVAIEGTAHIKAVHLRDGQGKITCEETNGLFVFIGARPRTDFLPPEVVRDELGFVLTGKELLDQGQWLEKRNPELLETSLPGLFASGDCRAGTTKRVATSIGDGALAVTGVHKFLETFSQV